MPVGFLLNVSSSSSNILLNGALDSNASIFFCASSIASLEYFSSDKGVSVIAHSPVDLLIAIQPPKSVSSALAYKYPWDT